MDIRKAAIYCRGEEAEFQIGVCLSFIIDKGLRNFGVFSDDPGSVNPDKALLKLIDYGSYNSFDVVIVRNYDILEDDRVKQLLDEAEFEQPIIGAEDLCCTDENLNLETLKFEKKRRAGKTMQAVIRKASVDQVRVVNIAEPFKS